MVIIEASIRRTSALAAALVLVGGCRPLPPRLPDAAAICESEQACLLVATRLDPAAREEIEAALRPGWADDAHVEQHERSLLAVHYDGEHLYLLPHCNVVGDYAWHERAPDAASEVWDPERASVLVRERGEDAFTRDSTEAISRDEPADPIVVLQPTRHGEATSWVADANRADDCAWATHVVSELVVGIEAGATEPRTIALQLSPLPSPKGDRTPISAPAPSTLEQIGFDPNDDVASLAAFGSLVGAALRIVGAIGCAAGGCATDGDDEL